MKTKLISIILVFAFVLALGACNKTEYKTDVTAKTISDALIEAFASADGYRNADSDFIDFNMSGASELCEDSAIMLSASNKNYDEFGVFKAKTEEDAKKLADLCKTYLELKLVGTRPDYLPDEYPKMQSATVKAYGCYVIYTILSDADTKTADTVIKGILAK